MFSFWEFSDNTHVMHARIPVIRKKKQQHQNKKAVEQNSICIINCKTKIYLVSFSLKKVPAWWPIYQSQTDWEISCDPSVKHCINFFAFQQTSLLKVPLFSLDLLAGLIAGLFLNFNCICSKFLLLSNISSGCIPLLRLVLLFVHSHFSNNLHL